MARFGDSEGKRLTRNRKLREARAFNAKKQKLEDQKPIVPRVAKRPEPKKK